MGIKFACVRTGRRLTRGYTHWLLESRTKRPKKGVRTVELAAGSKAPGFNLPRNGGGTISLADLAGRSAVLFFYPKDDTPSCTSEAIAFSALNTAFSALGATVIGLSPDPVKKHDKFAAKHRLSVILAADEDKEAIGAYGVWREKSMYGRKYMGVERTTFLVDGDGVIVKVWEKVKVPGHAEEVLKAVEAL